MIDISLDSADNLGDMQCLMHSKATIICQTYKSSSSTRFTQLLFSLGTIIALLSKASTSVPSIGPSVNAESGGTIPDVRKYCPNISNI